MRKPRILGQNKTNYYHLMSRIVSGDFVLGEKEKAFFRYTMRRLEKFMGVKVLTYCIMTNHFHILLEVSEVGRLSDKELLRRIEGFYSRERFEKEKALYLYFKSVKERMGDGSGLERWRAGFLNRMGDLSSFGKELKERFTRWYNWKNDREGTLWSARFKSVLVEGSEDALLTMAAYIDLNPVRAKMVKDPKDYRFCGYGEAMGGGTVSREGVCALARVIRRDNKLVAWEKAQSIYRVHLFAEGDGSGMDAERVKEVLESRGALSKGALLRCRVRYFTDGLAIGSKGFVENVFETHRGWFGLKRKTGARKIKCSSEPFYCLRDLRKEPVRAPV